MAISETVLKCRGLPWAAEPSDVVNFFSESTIMGGAEGIKIMKGREGRPTGEAYVEFESPHDAQEALKKNNEHMGTRYIEVFTVKNTELEWILKKQAFEGPVEHESVVRLRGLPFGCTKDDIAVFFDGLEIVPNGIMLQLDETGRTTGNAYVNFSSPDMAEQALGKHKESIGHRYIEVFHSSMQEALSCLNFMMSQPVNVRPTPYARNDRFDGGGYGGGMGRRGGMGGRGMRRGGGGGGYNNYGGDGGSNFRGGRFSSRGGRGDRGGRGRGGGGGGRNNPGSDHASSTGHSVHMRGLPYSATDDDIYAFFSPLEPLLVEFEYNDFGKLNGEADVDFASHDDAVEAMQKDRQEIGHRYIELFLNSSVGQSFGGGGNRGGNSFQGGAYGGNKGFFGGSGDGFSGGYTVF